MSQIKNGSHGNNLDYKPSVQTYTDAGIPSTATINAVMALSNDGQERTNGNAKSGGIWIDKNPSQAAGGVLILLGVIIVMRERKAVEDEPAPA